MESLAQDHLTFMSHLEPQIFVYILQTLHEGLTALGTPWTDFVSCKFLNFSNFFVDTMICTCCCTSLDHIIAFLYKRVSRVNKPRRPHAGMRPEGDNILRVLEVHPDILRQVYFAEDNPFSCLYFVSTVCFHFSVTIYCHECCDV